MRLDQELVVRGLCESRTEAQELIESGSVLVNGIDCRKQTRQISISDDIHVTSRRRYVSRGGEKLSGILHDIFVTEDMISSFCKAKTALDIGSSTGGFTDCLLQYGVAHVDCVDVGTAQLHPRLQKNPQVLLFENTDIRKFKAIKPYDIIVADLSFIPLATVLKEIISFGAAGYTSYFLLIKPQFEVGKGNTKKGIVKDSDLVYSMLHDMRTRAEEYSLKDIQLFPCHIQGGDGNQEFFMYGKL